MPAEDDAKPATRAQLKTVQGQIKTVQGQIKTVQGQIKTVHDQLDAKIDGVKADLAGVEKRLDAKIDGVIVELVKTQASVREIHHTLETRVASKDDLRGLTATIDAFLNRLETYGRETLTLPHLIDEQAKDIRSHEARLGEHDRRLKVVEARS